MFVFEIVPFLHFQSNFASYNAFLLRHLDFFFGTINSISSTEHFKEERLFDLKYLKYLTNLLNSIFRAEVYPNDN